jgi:hypothetical protein
MLRSISFALALLFALTAQANSFPKAEITWSGIYSVASTTSVSEAKSLSGKISQSVGPVAVEPTSRVPATLGTRFGFGYVIKTADIQDPIVRYVWRFPKGGLLNTSTGQVAQLFEIERPCHVGAPCANSWLFNHDWELKPGKWTAEVWLGSTLLVSQSFEVYLP